MSDNTRGATALGGLVVGAAIGWGVSEGVHRQGVGKFLLSLLALLATFLVLAFIGAATVAMIRALGRGGATMDPAAPRVITLAQATDPAKLPKPPFRFTDPTGHVVVVTRVDGRNLFVRDPRPSDRWRRIA